MPRWAHAAPGRTDHGGRLLGCSCVLSPGRHLRLFTCRPQGLCAAKKGSGNKGASAPSVSQATQLSSLELFAFLTRSGEPGAPRWSHRPSSSPAGREAPRQPQRQTDLPLSPARVAYQMPLKKGLGLEALGLLSTGLWGRNPRNGGVSSGLRSGENMQASEASRFLGDFSPSVKCRNKSRLLPASETQTLAVALVKLWSSLALQVSPGTSVRKD